jgi:anthranilate synthase component 1
VNIFGLLKNLKLYIEKNKPNFIKIKRKIDPSEIFSKINHSFDNTYLLESVTGPKKLSEFTYIGFEPILSVRAKDQSVEIDDHVFGNRIRNIDSDPIYLLKRLMRQFKKQNSFSRFVGGAVGYFSFNAYRYWEQFAPFKGKDIDYPDFEFDLYDQGLVFDHINNDIYYYFYNDNKIDQLFQIINGNFEFESFRYGKPRPNIKQKQFEDLVLKAKEYIFSGDVFQVVISKRFEFNIEGDLMNFYRILRKINPSPYMYHLKMGKRQIIGSSPEMLVRVEERKVETYPIAGTRPRVEDSKKNKSLEKELLADPKDRAEHIMLLDLARNDIGRVSKFGSIQIPENMVVNQYSHVQHIVSHVVGELKDKMDCFDALKSTFPAGTVSGAPKIRAIEIIEELEKTKRGPYAGAIGYFSFNGNADFAITIRTLFSDGKKGNIQAGAGIVADSIPEKEWDETEQKASALLNALYQAEDKKNESFDDR